MSNFEISLPAFTQREMECRQQDLRHVMELIYRALQQKGSEYNPKSKSTRIAATYDAAWQQGRQGALIIPQTPYFHPSALIELKYVETDLREDALSFEQTYTFEQTNDRDLFVMVSDKVRQRTTPVRLSLAGLQRVMNTANIIEQVEETMMMSAPYAVALEEVETYASLQPAMEDDITALKELLKIAITGDVHDELRTV